MFSSLTLRIKIILFAAAFFLSLLLVAILGLQSLRHASEIDNIARINQLMKTTVNIVEQFEQYASSGELSEHQAKQLAIRLSSLVDPEKVHIVSSPMKRYKIGTNFFLLGKFQQTHKHDINVAQN